ncbi:MAG: class I SAM-dependent DNA methyltransferase, partial [Caldilineaceae bacterium]
MISPPERHDAYAPHYDEDIRGYGVYLADALFGLCYEFVTAGSAVLDIGIGTGYSAQNFARAGALVDGIDYSPVMLELVRRKGFARSLWRHDLSVAPWPTQSARYHLAVCVGVLPFLPDLEPLFAETMRVLTPGGHFAFTTKRPRREAGEEP